MVGPSGPSTTIGGTNLQWLDCTSTTTSPVVVKWARSAAITAVKYSDDWGRYCNGAALEGWVKEVIPDKLPIGARTLGLPDGSKLILDALGNYRIEDQNAKVTYKANRLREFSPHLNASDLLAQFVRYVGSLGVRQKEVLNLPLELFVNWLIIEAAERDQDPVPPDVVPVVKHQEFRRALKPHCARCGRFIPRARYRERRCLGRCGKVLTRPRVPALIALQGG